MAFISFRSCNPLDFVKKAGYNAQLDIMDDSGPILLAQLDGSNEIFMDVMLYALMDLGAEGKTIANVRYKGKGTRRWFQTVYPTITTPSFYGVLDRNNALLGYLVASKSMLSPTRVVIGMALVKPCRGRGFGHQLFKHIQDNIDKMFQPAITEVFFETTKDNLPMLAIGRKLGFKENILLANSGWGDAPANRVRLLWKKAPSFMSASD